MPGRGRTSALRTEPTGAQESTATSALNQAVPSENTEPPGELLVGLWLCRAHPTAAAGCGLVSDTGALPRFPSIAVKVLGGPGAACQRGLQGHREHTRQRLQMLMLKT